MLLLLWRHQFRISGSERPLTCICLYIHCQFSGVTSPPSERITEPPLHEPTLQHSSRDNPLTNPYKKPPANRSPAPVASTAFASPIAGTRTIWHRKFSWPVINYGPKGGVIMTSIGKGRFMHHNSTRIFMENSTIWPYFPS